jgi:hypothetical protein
MCNNTKLIFCYWLAFVYFFKGCDVPTPPDSDDERDEPTEAVPFRPEDSDSEEPQDMIDEPEHSEPEPVTGRQKARAAVLQLHPPEMLAKLCTGFIKKENIKIVGSVRSHDTVPPGTQPDGILSDVSELRVRMNRAGSHEIF